MKRWMSALTMLAFLDFATSAWALPMTGSWDSRNGDFNAGGWREFLNGPSHGDAGNEFRVLGESDFMLVGALFNNSVNNAGVITSDLIGGTLRVFQPGPWWTPADGADPNSFYEFALDPMTFTWEAAGASSQTDWSLTGTGRMVGNPDIILTLRMGFSGFREFQLPPFIGFPAFYLGSNDYTTIDIVGPTVIPEPLSVALIGLGMGGLAITRRARARRGIA